jgi:hypothetical protein
MLIRLIGYVSNEYAILPDRVVQHPEYQDDQSELRHLKNGIHLPPDH